MTRSRASLAVPLLLAIWGGGACGARGEPSAPRAAATGSGADASLIPADRVTTWNPGLNAVGGIPERKRIHRTVAPRGGALDDTAQIQAALDTCPADGVVLLTAGTFNINGQGLSLRRRCTLRGSGTGTPGSGDGGTRLVKADRETNANFAVLYVGHDCSKFSSSVELAADAVKGTTTASVVRNSGIHVGELVLVDHVTTSDPLVFWGPNHEPPGGGSRRWFTRQDRSLSQILEVTAVKGNALTFATPFHVTFKTAYGAQLSRYEQPWVRYAGVEDLYVYGGRGGDFHGNISVSECAYCWVRNVESHYAEGSSVGFYGTYRSELRDSYVHETPTPNPGGGGYLTSLSFGASDNLFENNIMWYGNKVIVMRATGGGNVVAYNYMDDALGSSYPNLPEAGINAGHYTTPHMELLEGNRSHSFQGDAFWGNSIAITIFRNHLTGLRGAIGPLATYTHAAGRVTYPYMDLQGRAPVRLEGKSRLHNFVGNVLGFEGQRLLTYSGPGYRHTQTGWVYEALTAEPEPKVPMWKIGFASCGRTGCPPWDPTTVEDTLRNGNFDWYTRRQRWHGIGGSGDADARAPAAIPDSLYLTHKPAFFGSSPWPWVDPTTGRVTTLPAKARFDAMMDERARATRRPGAPRRPGAATPSRGCRARGTARAAPRARASPARGATIKRWNPL